VNAGDSLGPQTRPFVSRWPVVIGWVAMLIFTLYACTRMVAAGDTWVAMACGRHFVRHGVNTVEPFSANSHKAGPTAEEVKTWPGWAQWITGKVGLETVRYWHPTGWVNQNWLTHVIFYKLTTALGSETEPYYDALVLWKFALYILAAVALYYTARLYGVNPALAAASVCFAMLTGRSFFDIRPAGFSNLLVAVLILILALASYKNGLLIWLIVPLIIFWSNVHGGYIYAFMMLGPFVVWHTVMRLPQRWATAAYSILTWLTLYGMAFRFLRYEHLKPVALGQDALFYLTAVAIAGSIALARSRKIREDAFLAYHIAASCILFLLLLTRFFPDLHAAGRGLRAGDKDELESFVALSRLSYLGIFSFALLLGTVVLFLKDKVVRVMDAKGILHAVAAGAVAFVAMVVFNPFHLTNLTHTFVISISKHAERWRNVHEWHRAFDWTNPVGTAVPFLFLYIIGWLVLIAWVAVLIQASRVANRPVKKRLKPAPDYDWPKMDLGLMIVAAMTIYLAIRSRRFIPIAGYAACPVLALLIQETVRRLLGVAALRRQEKMDPPALPQALSEATQVGMAVSFVVLGVGALLVGRWFLFPVPGYPGSAQPRLWMVLLGSLLTVLAFVPPSVLYGTIQGAAVPAGRVAQRDLLRTAVRAAPLVLTALVLGFGVWFAAKFKEVYLDPWPLDARYKSMFMRMTASYTKPFEACAFMRQNNLSGKMYNYWTEGGFIAWGQDPDPETGRIPLQLFMDGRAQAAYDVPTFDLWSDILSGGPLPFIAARTDRSLTAKDYTEIGTWVSERLRQHGVWVVLMPDLQFDKPFTRGLEYNADWRIVYTDDKQKMFVDFTSPQGAALYYGIFTGQTAYPNEYLANLALGHTLLRIPDNPAQKKRGLELLVKALHDYPSPAPMKDMVFLGYQFAELRPRIDEVCQQYALSFEQNRAAYARQDGYNFRLHVAWLALAHLEQVAQAANDKATAQIYRQRIEQYKYELDRSALRKKW